MPVIKHEILKYRTINLNYSLMNKKHGNLLYNIQTKIVSPCRKAVDLFLMVSILFLQF